MIQGLRGVKALPILDGLEDPDLETEAELEVTSLLIGGALVRSGFEITNSCVRLSRIHIRSLLIGLKL